jgi:proteasome assembly chaperone (PAC2) family protein
MKVLRDPWLVAAWPGMGAVGTRAVNYLAEHLDVRPLAELQGEAYFDVRTVSTQNGILAAPRRPQTVLAGWRHPGDGRDLVLLLGEQQPLSRLWPFSEAVLDLAGELGVTRAFTFAAMASPASPKEPARVFTAATDADALTEVRTAGVELLHEGEIGGMNGVFLAAAAARGIPGTCLLGEFPYFASALPNPKASAAVLRVFARLADFELDLAELDRQGEQLERRLVEWVERLEQVQGARESAESEGVPADWPEPEREDELSPEDAARIGALFAEAERDRSRATALKAELDRLGVFQRFEDRFLDLFKRAE